MANEYATPAELKASLSLTGESFADPDITLALTAASRAVEDITNRRFWQDADANQARYYTPQFSAMLIIDDLVTLTSVQVDQGGDGVFEEAWTVNTDFVLEPVNAAANGEPYFSLRIQPYSGRFMPPGLPRSVKVTGRFGWPAVPEGVKSATMILASKLVRRVREAPFGVIGIGIDGDAVRIARVDPDIGMLLSGFTYNPLGP